MNTLLIPIIIVSAIALIIIYTLINSKNKDAYQVVKKRFDKILKQASVLLPQTADYALSLGKDGALVIHELNNNINKLRNVINDIEDNGVDSSSLDEIKSFEFQQTLLQSEKHLKDLSKKIVAASKKASAINLPKAPKNKSTILSLDEVGLVDKEEI